MNKGFTLVELLVVLAISTFLVGMALVGTQGTQAQITLNAAAASFVSNINFVKNNAIAGSVSLGSLTANPNKNWVYGFAIFPGELSPTPPSNPGLCQTTAKQSPLLPTPIPGTLPNPGQEIVCVVEEVQFTFPSLAQI